MGLIIRKTRDNGNGRNNKEEKRGKKFSGFLSRKGSDKIDDIDDNLGIHKEKIRRSDVVQETTSIWNSSKGEWEERSDEATKEKNDEKRENLRAKTGSEEDETKAGTSLELSGEEPHAVEGDEGGEESEDANFRRLLPDRKVTGVREPEGRDDGRMEFEEPVNLTIEAKEPLSPSAIEGVIRGKKNTSRRQREKKGKDISSDKNYCSEEDTSRILRLHGKKLRCPSSRPTSLETISEGTPSAFSFQDAFIKSSVSSRRDYCRDCKMNLDYIFATSEDLPDEFSAEIKADDRQTANKTADFSVDSDNDRGDISKLFDNISVEIDDSRSTESPSISISSPPSSPNIVESENTTQREFSVQIYKSHERTDIADKSTVTLVTLDSPVTPDSCHDGVDSSNWKSARQQHEASKTDKGDDGWRMIDEADGDNVEGNKAEKGVRNEEVEKCRILNESQINENEANTKGSCSVIESAEIAGAESEIELAKRIANARHEEGNMSHVADDGEIVLQDENNEGSIPVSKEEGYLELDVSENEEPLRKGVKTDREVFTVYIQQDRTDFSDEISQFNEPRTQNNEDLTNANRDIIEAVIDESEEGEEEDLKETKALSSNRRKEEESLHKEYRHLVKAIQSLDSLNDQIVEFIFSGTTHDFELQHEGSPKQREALKSSMTLMRRLLLDAQSKFRKMVEDNKQLASRIDGDLQTAHQEVNLLRQELADTNRRITELQAHNHHDHGHEHYHHNLTNHDHLNQEEEEVVQEAQEEESAPDTPTSINDSNKYRSESSSNCLAEEMSQLQLENEKLTARNRSLQREVEELRRVKESMVEEDLQLKPRINQMTMELTHAKEALSALKADRKRLKAEKFDLLNQMKQLYATLEDKEKELRDFIRNYEQRMKESDESLRHLASERDETEREKWNILKHARDESEKVVKLSAQLGLKETAFRKLQDELEHVRKQLNSVGYYSDAESVRTNGLPTPTASTPACSPLPVSTPTPTPNGRGSSADSGVRLSSDRDSTASHDGTPTITVERGGSLDCDTFSVCSSATAASYNYHYACGVGTPKESPSLSPLYATPVSLRGEIQGGDDTPTSAPTPTAAMSGLANSNANSGGLSRSAEQLCERLAEAAESSKGRGSSTLLRKSQKSGGTWGSISRVFARQKKRAALDASLYEGNGSDKRASWSPSSSLCASPLTEESYSEKLRLLEEAQHIPLERWKALTVLAWLEVTLGMPQYGAMCAENVRSGKVLLELNDSELETGLGIGHPMHRKKLRLAIEELREPRLTRFPRISILGHTWVSSEWLPDLGLPQYSEAFANNLVDGRLLEALTKKELEKHLGVHRKFHQASIIHGVHLLRIVRFDRQTLAERRRQCEHMDTDPVVWTNHRWVRWARSIDLAEYADNLKDSGVHGALVTLESSFTSDTMATALGIPQSKNIIRRHLATELESLVTPARKQLEEQARYAKIERRRQEKLAAGGSLGRSFSRSYGTGLEKGDKDKRRASLRSSMVFHCGPPRADRQRSNGSLSRALGLRLREEATTIANNGGESSSSGGQSPAVSSRINSHHAHHARPRSSVMPSAAYVHHETHRRVKSIGDIETITVTPV